MDTTSKPKIEVYDNLTGEHYERECTPEEMFFYEQWEREQNETPSANTDALPDAG